MLKYIIVLVFLVGFKETATSQYKQCSDLSFKDKSVLLQDSTLNQREEKSPFLVGFLSFIVPGAAIGQLNNEQYVDAGIRIGISVLSLIWASEAGHLLDVGGSRPGAWQVYAAASIFGANWISSVPDAVIYAIAKNRKIRLKNKYLKKENGFNLNLGYDLRGLTLRAGYSF